MIAVVNASPLHYLILLGVIDDLPSRFETLLTPPSVLQEMRHPHAPEAVRHWAGALPAWLQVRPPVQPLANAPVRLGAGERDALALRLSLRDAV